MRSLTALLMTVLLLLACGCTEESPSQPAATPTAPAVPATTLPATPPVVPATSQPTPTKTASVSDNTIMIVKNAFSPADMTVRTGSTVRWVNADDHPHNIEFRDKAFSASTFLLGSSQSFSQRFDHAGTYEYACLIHPQMKGTITVED